MGQLDSTAKRILVVDDEEDVLVLVCRILRDVGYEVLSASDGADAIEQIEREAPDLVVLDLMMPGIDGWGVLERLRRQRNPPPVVVLTARTDYRTFERGVREGATAYVCKPFRFHELVAICQRLLLPVQQPAGAERRAYPRRRLVVEVEVQSRDGAPIAIGELMNLSLGGASIELGLPLEVGEGVRLGFRSPSGDSAFSVESQVLWRGNRGGGTTHGMAFTHLGSDEKQRVSDLLLPP